MLIFFFTLIFIAEVKLTIDLIEYIKKVDRAVCEINDKISIYNNSIKKEFTTLRIALNKILLSLNKIELKIKQKKENFKIIILKNILTGILFIILNPNGKKVLSVIDLVFSVNDFLKKWKNSK